VPKPNANFFLGTALLPVLGLAALGVAMRRGDGVCLDCDAVFDEHDVTHICVRKIMPKNFDPEKYRAARRSCGTWVEELAPYHAPLVEFIGRSSTQPTSRAWRVERVTRFRKPVPPDPAGPPTA